jgi:hypothetical protein
MNLWLYRHQFRSDGIFGSLIQATGEGIGVTLEHAFPQSDGNYLPSVPCGDYLCIRGFHLLKGMMNPIETFLLQHVPGHSEILIHPGNFNEDSDGCILIGTAITGDDSGQMIIDSDKAFSDFMALQAGVNEFSLTVLDE